MSRSHTELKPEISISKTEGLIGAIVLSGRLFQTQYWVDNYGDPTAQYSTDLSLVI